MTHDRMQLSVDRFDATCLNCRHTWSELPGEPEPGSIFPAAGPTRCPKCGGGTIYAAAIRTEPDDQDTATPTPS